MFVCVLGCPPNPLMPFKTWPKGVGGPWPPPFLKSHISPSPPHPPSLHPCSTYIAIILNQSRYNFFLHDLECL